MPNQSNNNVPLGKRVDALPRDLQRLVQTQFLNELLADKETIVKLIWSYIVNGNTTPIDNILFKRLQEGDPILTLSVFMDLYSHWFTEHAGSGDEIPPPLLRKVLDISSKVHTSMQPVILVTMVDSGMRPILGKDTPSMIDNRTRSYIAIKAIKSYFECLQSGRSGPFTLVQKGTKRYVNMSKNSNAINSMTVHKVKSAHDVYDFCMKRTIYSELIVTDDWYQLISPAFPIVKKKTIFEWTVPSDEMDKVWKRIPDELLIDLVKKRLGVATKLPTDPVELVNRMVRVDGYSTLSHHIAMQKWQAYCNGKKSTPDARIFILQNFIARNMSTRAVYGM